MDIKSRPRHYEIDALRVIALALLILYHIFFCYQPFANMLMFLQYDQLLEKYWFVGELLNIWRIPVLFLISGMAVGFILGRRTLKELVYDRMMRIVPPLFFGSLVIFRFSRRSMRCTRATHQAISPIPTTCGFCKTW